MKSKEKNGKMGNTAQPAVHRSGPRQQRQHTLTKGLRVAPVVKNPPATAGDMRHGFDPWAGKIPWRREWQPLQYACLPGKSHGKRSLAGYSPWSQKRVLYNLVTK